MLSRISQALDAGTALFFGAVTVHFATIDLWTLLSRTSLLIALVLGAGKLFEMFTGKRVSSLFRKIKSDERRDPDNHQGD